MANGEYQEALIDCFKALQVAPDSRKLLLRLVHIYTSLGEADEAVHWLTLIQNPGPTEKEAMKARAMHRDHKLAMDLIGQTETSSIESMQLVISTLDRARKHQSPSASLPWDWQVTLALAHLNLYDLELDTEKRVTSLERAKVAIDSIRASDEYYHSEALFLYGRLLYSQGQDQKAIQTLESATRATSHCISSEKCAPCKDGIRWLGIVRELSQLKERGNNAFKAHDWVIAKDYYNRALVVNPTNRLTNAKLYQNRARCYIKLGFYDKAIDDCTKAIDLDATYIKAQATKATATRLSGDLGGALAEWKLVRKMSPGDSQAINNIQSLASELADPQRAILDKRKATYGGNVNST
jgi:DnaJ family protein C protein 7